MSWSYRITILYLGFVGLIATLVVISSQNKEELVAKDYYEQELVYQEKIDAMNNEKSLTERISYQVGQENVSLQIPASLRGAGFSGEIYFYCPSDSKKDKRTPFQPDNNGNQIINKKTLLPGAYKMRLSWASDGKKYFREEVVNIQ